MSDVLVVAGAGVDTIVRVPALPVPLADSHVVPPIRDWAGHTGTCVAFGSHALGMSTTFIDCLGEDALGDLVRAECAKRGLDTDWLPNPAGTSRSVNLVDPDGRRMSLFDPRDPGAPLPRGFYLPHLALARHVHVCISDHARGVLDDATDRGVPTSTDLHDWDGHADHHRDFAYGADVVFVSTARIAGRVGEIAGDIFERGRASVVVAMSGGDGCHVTSREYPEQVRHFPALAPPGPVVDTNGAGDAFVAGFLYARLRRSALDACVRAGLAAGAFAVTQEGTHSGFIDAERLRAAGG